MKSTDSIMIQYDQNDCRIINYLSNYLNRLTTEGHHFCPANEKKKSHLHLIFKIAVDSLTWKSILHIKNAQILELCYYIASTRKKKNSIKRQGPILRYFQGFHIV